MNEPVPPRKSIPNSQIVQSLRGLAALAVVVYHQRGLLSEHSMVSAVADTLCLGVDLFFVISGFVIGLSTEGGRNSSVAVFMLRRIFRIVPLAWAVLVLVLLIRHADFGLIVRGFLFLPENPPSTFPANPPQWTLSYEFLFYIIFAGALSISCIWRCEISIAVIFFLTLLDFLLPHSNSALRNFLNSDLLLEFAAGVAIAKCLLVAPLGLSRRTIAALCMTSVAAGSALLILRPLDSGLSNFGGGAALVLAGALLFERYHPLRMPRILLILGELSFAIYITQYFAFMWVESKLFWTPLHKTWIFQHTAGLSRLALILLAVVTIAALLHILVEKPGIRLGRALTRRLGNSRGRHAGRDRFGDVRHAAAGD